MSTARKALGILTLPAISLRAHVILALAIVLGAAMIRALLFSGYVALDDGEYTRFAYLLAHGRPLPVDYTGPAVFPLRVGIYAPAALVLKMFGVSEWTVVLYPFLLSLAAVALAYFAAAWLFGWQAGVIAATLLSVFELDIDNASMLLPDHPAAFLAAAGVMLVIVAERRQARSPKAFFWTGLAAGLAFGASWLTKESVVYLAPFCLVLMAITIKRRGNDGMALWGGVAAGSLAVLGTEMATHWAMTGDVLLRLHAVEHNYQQWENGFFTAGSDMGFPVGMSYRDALIDRLFVGGPSRIFLDRTLLYLPLVAMIGALYGWVRRDRSFLFPALWLASLVLMFNFASTSSETYLPIPLFYRYMYLMFFPAFVLAAGFLTKLLFAEAQAGSAVNGSTAVLLGRVAGLAVLGFVLWTAAFNVYYGINSRVAWIAEARMFHEMADPRKPIYADALTLRTFEFFAGYPPDTAWVGFEHLGSADEIPAGSLVLVNKRYIGWLNRNAGMWVTWPAAGKTSLAGYRMHDFYERPPSTWTRVWANDNARLFRVDTGGRVVQAGAGAHPIGDER